MKEDSQIEIYKAKDGSTQINVKFEQETVWLSQAQMQDLFQKSKSTISEHIKNIFKEGELDKKMVVRKSRTTNPHGAIANKKQTNSINIYNLDVIISVGYRVKSKRGTQFRIWANSVLKEYLIKGYVVNEKRLAQQQQELLILKNGIQILNRVAKHKKNDNNWLEIFSKGLNLLDDYDHEKLDLEGLTKKEASYPSIEDYQKLILDMQKEFNSEIFGIEKDSSFQSSIAQIQKGFGKTDFYSSIEEKATMLLYLIVKNHSFVDGNKRIAAACFLKFLEQNNLLFNKQKATIISNDTLASLTLFIAASKPNEMETVKKLVISVLNRNNY